MNNSTVVWTLPTERESGGPLPVEEIAGVDVSMSANLGTDWTFLGRVLPSETQTTSVNDLAPGDWIYKMIVIDTDDRPSKEWLEPFKVADDSPPGTVTDVSVTLS